MAVSGIQSENRPSIVNIEDSDDDDQNLPFITIRPLRDLLRNPDLFCSQQFQAEPEEDEDDSFQSIISMLNGDLEEQEEQTQDIYMNTLPASDHNGDENDLNFEQDVVQMVESTFLLFGLGNLGEVDGEFGDEFSSFVDNSSVDLGPVPGETDMNLDTDQTVGPVQESDGTDVASMRGASVSDIPSNAQETAETLERSDDDDDDAQLSTLISLANLSCRQSIQVEGTSPAIFGSTEITGDDISKKSEAKKMHRKASRSGKSSTRSKKQKMSTEVAVECPKVAVEKALIDNPGSHESNDEGSDLETKSPSIKTLPAAGTRSLEESSDESDVPLAILRKKYLKAKRPRKDSEDQSQKELELVHGSFDFSEKPKLNYSKKYWSSKIQADAVAMWEAMQEPERDISRLKKLMKRTFTYRQQEYNDEDADRILSNFPALRDYRLIKYDMTLLRKMDLKALDVKLTDHLDRKYKACDPKDFSESDPVISSALEQLKKQSSNKELLRDIQLLCVGYQATKGKLHKNLYAQRMEKDDEEPFKSAANTPSIDILGTLGCNDTEISIYCEGNLVTKTPNFYEAVMAAYSLYWLFNIKYESNCIRFFELLDSLVE